MSGRPEPPPPVPERIVRLAVAAYPVEWHPDRDSLVAKLDGWVGRAAAAGAELLVFPEHAGIEVALVGEVTAASPAEWCRRAAERAADYAALAADLARRHGVHLVAGSLPVRTDAGLVDRVHLFAPDGRHGHQDKQVLTPWERAHTPLVPGDPPAGFDTAIGRIGILVCYDAEFPPLARAIGADILAVPACTDTAAGATRLRVAARARALEGECLVLHAALIGRVEGCPLVEDAFGRAAIFGPPDDGFPPTGIVAQGGQREPGWTLADFDPSLVRRVRTAGAVAPRTHYAEAERRAQAVAVRPFGQDRP